MPCNSDYLNPTTREKDLQSTAKLLVYVYNQIDKKVSYTLLESAEDCYCKRDYVPELCSAIKNLNTEQVEKIIYDGHNSNARKLANWWYEHKREDEAREIEEKYRFVK